MGNRASRIACCFSSQNQSSKYPQDGYGVQFGEPLDEGLGHSFCYIRPILDSPISSPHQSTDLSISQPTLEASDSAEQCLPDLQQTEKPKNASISETSFKSISGASVSANTATPRSMICNELCNLQSERAATFEATPSFAALPLQLIPKGIAHSGSISGTLSGPLSGPLERGFLSGPIERGFMSGPLERGFLSGPMERGFMSGPLEQIDRTNLSAPLARRYRRYLKTRTSLKRFMKTVGNPVKKALSKTASNLVWPKLPFVGPLKGDRKKGSDGDSQDFSFDTSCASSNDVKEAQNLQWAQGRAGEDRMHVVLSEEHGWLFVGIYDGFNGPDAPDFLMGNLYPAIYKELKGLLWDTNEAFVLRSVGNQSNCDQDGKPLGSRDKGPRKSRINGTGWVRNHTKVSDMGLGQDLADLSIKDSEESSQYKSEDAGPCLSTDSVTVTAKTPNSQSNTFEQKTVYHPDKENSLRNLIFGDLARELEDHKQPGRKGSLGRKIKSVYGKRNRRNKKLFQWRYDWEQERLEAQKSSTEDSKQDQGHRKETRRMAVNHAAVLKALSRALLETEAAFLEMADKAAAENPELALMGSCVLVMLMKDEDVYIMNVGDSRAIVAQRKKVGFLESLGKSSSWQVRLGDAKLDNQERIGSRDSMLRMELEKIIEETPMELAAQESYDFDQISPPAVSSTLGALQLSFDHSTSVPEEVMRIKALHADDAASVSNDRVKGSLKVTRAFGAGFLKQPKWNDALLEMFRIDYVGTAPYITCKPSLSHHKLGPRDHFLVLSSDGLYQYLSNEEVVSHVEWFMEKSPDGDPAQYLIEELLFRAARKAGMDFHELLDIPQGDRRKYHDDVSVMVISLEGRIWRSSS